MSQNGPQFGNPTFNPPQGNGGFGVPVNAQFPTMNPPPQPQYQQPPPPQQQQQYYTQAPPLQQQPPPQQQQYYPQQGQKVGAPLPPQQQDGSGNGPNPPSYSAQAAMGAAAVAAGTVGVAQQTAGGDILGIPKPIFFFGVFILLVIFLIVLFFTSSNSSSSSRVDELAVIVEKEMADLRRDRLREKEKIDRSIAAISELKNATLEYGRNVQGAFSRTWGVVTSAFGPEVLTPNDLPSLAVLENVRGFDSPYDNNGAAGFGSHGMPKRPQPAAPPRQVRFAGYDQYEY